MAEASVTSKGQITIPAEIRKLMNLSAQDKVVFTMLPNGTTIMRAKNRSITSLAKSLKSSKKRIAVDDMMYLSLLALSAVDSCAWRFA